MSVDVVIVNWNAGEQLLSCVNSVISCESGIIGKVIIVDNGSSDNSASPVEGISNVLLIRAGENLGFGRACNLGALHSTADYLLFLNPDTVVVAESISVPIAFMERAENVSVGICGIQLYDDNGHVSRSCARFPSLKIFTAQALGLNRLSIFKNMSTHMSSWAHDNTQVVDHVIGAFYLIRRSLFLSLNGFDERFFVYLEDLDLSLRAYRLGYLSVFIADAQAFHAGGGTSRQVKARRLFYSLRSRLQFGFKHFPYWQAWTLVVVTCFFEPMTRTVWCLAGADREGVRNTWLAYRMLWSDLGRIVRGAGE